MIVYGVSTWVPRIAAQLATQGANMLKLEISGVRLSNQVYLSEAEGGARLTSDI
jgi:hypothetical protein